MICKNRNREKTYHFFNLPLKHQRMPSHTILRFLYPALASHPREHNWFVKRTDQFYIEDNLRVLPWHEPESSQDITRGQEGC